ncbi:MAG: Txe/YoeB family addiction module toxin [Blautia sp.]|nr:Txe/YoeB family addiction module toxin [Blautia sp.]
MQREPFTGEGKPEPLKDSPDGEWSRRINEKDRLVYMVSDENIIVTQCKGHYNDK